MKQFFGKRVEVWVCVLIFVTCGFVYLANGTAISSTDNIPSSLWAFHWLDNHSLNFDLFRGGHLYRTDTRHGADGIPHYFVEAPNGHLGSTYPIGNAILTFPIYVLFFVAIKGAEFFQGLVAGSPVDLLRLTDPEFEGALLSYQKLAATTVAALSVVVFYLIVRLKFNRAIACISTFIFAFATSTWVIGSQGLWQHGSSNLVVLCIVFCLFKANRCGGGRRRLLLVLAGIFCGLLPGVRSTSLLYSLAAIAYALFMYRREAIFLLLGLPSLFISASWNIYYFGFSLSNLVIGGYSRFGRQDASFTASFYQLTVAQFVEGFLGLLVSPSRGLLIFSPVVLLAIPGVGQVWRWRAGKDEKLVICLTLAAGLVFLQYCFFRIWSGGACYGPRYLTDILPMVGLAIAYLLAHWVEQWNQGNWRWSRLKLALLMFLIFWSTFTQAVGAFGYTNWDGIPYYTKERLWEWQDTQIERSANHVFYRAVDPIGDRTSYLKQWNGEIGAIAKRNGKPIGGAIVAQPSRKMVLQAQVKNIGTVPWVGYETGLSRGRTHVDVEFLDESDQAVRIKVGARSRLYVSGMPKPGETVMAIGRVVFPPQPGNYRMVLELGVGGIQQQEKREKPRLVVEARVEK